MTRVLVANAGSSSLKLRVLDGVDVVESLDVERWSGPEDDSPLVGFIERCGAVDAVGHRVVHGGDRFDGATLISADVLAGISSLAALAPLHQHRAVETIEAVGALLPGVPAVACFDTAFHRTMPPDASTYALPHAWRQRWSLARYGFHGLSHAHAAGAAARLVGRSVEELRVVSCHLGAGASLCAVLHGRSVDTTMGFTPLEGLVMATRSGSVDPGVVLWLLDVAGLSVAEVRTGLEHEAGLAGMSETSGDMRDVLAASDHDARAKLALDVYVHRLRAGIAAMAAAMGGLDVVAFTGGVGEHEPAVRARAVAGLSFLGIAVDDRANASARGDVDISEPASSARTVVVAAREDLEIARQAREVLG